MCALFVCGEYMSTKIYNGVMLNNVYTIQDMQDFVNSLKGPVKELVYKQRASDILHTACLIYDMHHVMGQDYFNPDEDTRIPLLVSSRRHVVLPENEATNYDIAIGIVDGYTLGMYFFDDRETEKIILHHPQVQYFGYWDNNDPDENVTEQEWALREELWNKLFENSHFPAEALFVQRILNTRYIMPEDHHMEAAIPTLEERRDAVIRNVSFSLAKKEWEDENEDDEENTYSDSIFEIMDRAKAKRDIARQAVPMTKLTKNITLAKLSEEIPENKNDKEEQDDNRADESST